jgi:hypothetical protein
MAEEGQHGSLTQAEGAAARLGETREAETLPMSGLPPELRMTHSCRIASLLVPTLKLTSRKYMGRSFVEPSLACSGVRISSGTGACCENSRFFAASRPASESCARRGRAIRVSATVGRQTRSARAAARTHLRRRKDKLLVAKGGSEFYVTGLSCRDPPGDGHDGWVVATGEFPLAPRAAHGAARKVKAVRSAESRPTLLAAHLCVSYYVSPLRMQQVASMFARCAHTVVCNRSTETVDRDTVLGWGT